MKYVGPIAAIITGLLVTWIGWNVAHAKKINNHDLVAVKAFGQQFANSYGSDVLIRCENPKGPYLIALPGEQQPGYVLVRIRPEHKPSASKADLWLFHHVIHKT